MEQLFLQKVLISEKIKPQIVISISAIFPSNTYGISMNFLTII